VDDLGGIAPAGGVIQLSDAVEKTAPLLPSPALHLRLTGHDHSLPSTAARGQPTPASNPQPTSPPPSSSSLFCRRAEHCRSSQAGSGPYRRRWREHSGRTEGLLAPRIVVRHHGTSDGPR